LPGKRVFTHISGKIGGGGFILKTPSDDAVFSIKNHWQYRRDGNQSGGKILHTVCFFVIKFWCQPLLSGRIWWKTLGFSIFYLF